MYCAETVGGKDCVELTTDCVSECVVNVQECVNKYSNVTLSTINRHTKTQSAKVS